MEKVRAKKNLGQHFLKDHNIARKIVSSLQMKDCRQVLEVGPGMGMLTGYLLEREGIDLKVVEIDYESVQYLQNNFPQLGTSIIAQDFLTMDVPSCFTGKFAVIGNFPYNISSQIFFRILEYRDHVPEVVGMIQKEVAERLNAGPGSKTYGILSVLLQAFFRIEYLFTVSENVFSPPPKVKSAVIRLVRNDVTALDCDEKLFFQVVKTGFNQRRKVLGNALKPLTNIVPEEFARLRAEQLSVSQFEKLTRAIGQSRISHL